MSSLVPEGMVPEVTGGTIILDLADGTQVVIKAPKARWALSMATRDISPEPPEWLDVDTPVIFGENWVGVAFHPLERLPGPNRAAFRLTRYYKPGGPRVSLNFPPEEDT